VVKLSLRRAFDDDAFAVAKAAAYSSILTFFPALLVLGAVLASSRDSNFMSKGFPMRWVRFCQPEARRLLNMSGAKRLIRSVF